MNVAFVIAVFVLYPVDQKSKLVVDWLLSHMMFVQACDRLIDMAVIAILHGLYQYHNSAKILRYFTAICYAWNEFAFGIFIFVSASFLIEHMHCAQHYFGQCLYVVVVDHFYCVSSLVLLSNCLSAALK